MKPKWILINILFILGFLFCMNLMGAIIYIKGCKDTARHLVGDRVDLSIEKNKVKFQEYMKHFKTGETNE